MLNRKFIIILLNIINDGRKNKLTMTKCNRVSGQSWKITKTP